MTGIQKRVLKSTLAPSDGPTSRSIRSQTHSEAHPSLLYGWSDRTVEGHDTGRVLGGCASLRSAEEVEQRPPSVRWQRGQGKQVRDILVPPAGTLRFPRPRWSSTAPSITVSTPDTLVELLLLVSIVAHRRGSKNESHPGMPLARGRNPLSTRLMILPSTSPVLVREGQVGLP